MSTLYNLTINNTIFTGTPAPDETVNIAGSFIALNTNPFTITALYSDPNGGGQNIIYQKTGSENFYNPALSGTINKFFNVWFVFQPNKYANITDIYNPNIGTVTFKTYTPNDTTLVKTLTAGYDNLLPSPLIITIATSNICFPAKTPVTLDQGIINIEEIDPSIHTIDNKPIVAVTQTKSFKDYLVCFDKDALGANLPSANTLISPEHKILHNGHLIKSKDFVDHFEHVYKVNYNGEILYNVLLDDYYKMSVNNLTVETLHPDCDVARLYNGREKTIKSDQAITKVMNKMVITKKKELKEEKKNTYMFLARK